MFGPAEQARFAPLMGRLPTDMSTRWHDLLAGGASSEAFGPLTLQEQLDEAQVEKDLARGRHQLVLSATLGAVVVAALVAVAVVLWPGGDDTRASGTIRFTDLAGTETEVSTEGPPPAVEPSLATAVDVPVVVTAGDGPVEDRLVLDPPVELLPRLPADVVATVFQYAGRARLVLVGPPGWSSGLCIQGSVTSSALRPFDTSYWPADPACGAEPPGRPADAACASSTTVLLDLDVPEGDVELAEGGTASAAAVRVALSRPDPAYEVLSIRGTIAVGSGQEVAVPLFGGEPGDTVTFDFTPFARPDRIGTCRLGTVDTDASVS